ncbi:hypothetical protein LshimejAT787_0704820 [Lyophyllum shimeji]|uniref:DUF6534 domain-containing protein n=1 Tax=Lyophyllum shimeji TaxID=47721 RepID=A0A9P3UP50_LYOSH|nr:hypothetical protein LshimejAT787_0704820 [Lyophyllum shimeji]
MTQDSPLTQEELQLAIFILGPWLIGCFIDVLLQGILFCQFSHYFGRYPDDGIGNRLAVTGLLILTTLKSVHSFASSWVLFIIHFKDLTGAIALNYTAWWLTSSGLMVASIGIYVQAFFCHRLWVISWKNYWVLAPIIVVLLFAYVSICLATYYISQGAQAGPHIATWFAAHLSSVFAGDLLITLSTAYFLLRSRKDLLPQTVGLINALIRLTFQTAAPAAMCAMFNLIFSQIYSGDNKLISSAFNQTLPKLYAFSMMWTLNARDQLRSYTVERFYDTSGVGARPTRENVELGKLGGVHVHKHVESRSVEIRKLFRHSTTGTETKNATEEYKIDA